jgi:hypothetical protein
MDNDSSLATIQEFISILNDIIEATTKEDTSAPDTSTSSWSVVSLGSSAPLSPRQETRTRFTRDLTWDGSKETEPRSRRARNRRQRCSAKDQAWVWIEHGKEEEEVLDSWVDLEYATERERQRLVWNAAVATSNT